MIRYLKADTSPGAGEVREGVNGAAPVKILTATVDYPTAERPTSSTFVREQVESLRRLRPEATIDVLLIDGSASKAEYFRAMGLAPRMVRDNGYDLVHAHFGITLLSLLFVPVPIVATFHGSDLLVRPAKYLCTLLARKAARCIVVSQKLRDVLGYGEIIPCGIDLGSFLSALQDSVPDRREEISLRVLFPARPRDKVKDFGLFQAVCEELERRGRRVEQVCLQDVERARVPEVFRTSDLMLLTSRSEGSPTVVKEAIAAKLPFVSVDVGDVKEWAALIDFGVVTPDRDPGTMADAGSALLARLPHRSRLDNSRCLGAMDITAIAGRIWRVYDDVSAADRRRQRR